MADAGTAAVDFLEERPDFEPILQEVITADADGPWVFDDIDCDSGNFGELVSREFVDSVDDGYRLTDRDAVRAALDGDGDTADDDAPGSTDETSPLGVGEFKPLSLGVEDSITFVRARVAGDNGLFALLLVASLALVAVVRSLTYDAVFRENHVVPTSNDPFHYFYWVNQLLAESPGYLDFPEIAAILGNRTSGEPFVYIIGWWATALLEVGPDSAGTVLALFPVVSSIVTAGILAWLVHTVTGDQRVTVLTVFALALLPANFLYTHLGFYDHHHLDYIWFTLMAATLVWLARDASRRETLAHLRNPLTWAVAALFGVASGSAMLTWNGAPLMLLAVAVYAAVALPSTLRADRPPLYTSFPLVAGLLAGTALGVGMHLWAGLQEFPVVLAPGLVAGGVLAVALVSEAASRAGQPPHIALGGAIGSGLAGTVVVGLAAPDLFARFSQRFFSDLLGRGGIGETRGLFDPELSIHFGPFEQFGLFALVLFPALAYVTWQCLIRHEPVWLVPTSFAWTFLGLATIQRRFAAELSVFAAFFAAVGLVWALSRASLCRPLDCFGGPTPVSIRLDRDSLFVARTTAIVILLVLAVVASVLVFSTILSIVPTTDSQYETAQWIADNSEDDPYVLSQWDRNRMYNYIVWGGGDGYNYAEDTYWPLLNDDDPDAWYDNLTDAEGIDSSHEQRHDSVDYLVIEDNQARGILIDVGYGQLFQLYGSALEEFDGLSHYRLVYVSKEESHTVFEPVRGAVIEGTADPSTVVEVTTPVELEHAEFEYVRRTTADANGTYEVRVPYPGTYETSTNSTATVTEGDVENGHTVKTAA